MLRIMRLELARLMAVSIKFLLKDLCHHQNCVVYKNIECLRTRGKAKKGLRACEKKMIKFPMILKVYVSMIIDSILSHARSLFCLTSKVHDETTLARSSEGRGKTTKREKNLTLIFLISLQKRRRRALLSCANVRNKYRP